MFTLIMNIQNTLLAMCTSVKVKEINLHIINSGPGRINHYITFSSKLKKR